MILLFQEIFEAVEAFVDLFHGGGEAETDVLITAETGAWHARNSSFFK